jgi:PIN domain nuclease of toxin-antitoxin system
LTTFDASPLVGLLIGEPGAHPTAHVLATAQRSTISAINLAEVVDRVTRAYGAPAHLVREQISLWTSLGLYVVDLSHGLADSAARLRIEHYHARQMPVSLADCCAIALARQQATPLATTDRPMARLARQLDIEVIALPDSRGQLPE